MTPEQLYDAGVAVLTVAIFSLGLGALGLAMERFVQWRARRDQRGPEVGLVYCRVHRGIVHTDEAVWHQELGAYVCRWCSVQEAM